MTEQPTGLRFDIYERVHLAEDQPDMRTLDSIEMVPLIQVNVEGEHAQLKGNLLLTGQYFSEQNNETRNLEYWIPVEITLPMNRVERLEDIAVEIENFDIDLLSSRLLNVTGVLSLRGFDTVPVVKDWQEESQEGSQQLEQQAEQERLAHKPKAEAPLDPNAETFVGFDTLNGDGTWLEEIVSEPESIGSDEEPAIFENDLEYETPEALPIPIEEKKELKVGFGTKAPSGREQLKNIKNLIQPPSDGRSGAGKKYGEREPVEDPSREGLRGDELEWKKLFLGDRGNERSFQQVRLCIVQKEETMDGIAERYSINAREIMLFNRLSNYQVAAGQVIYIPT